MSLISLLLCVSFTRLKVATESKSSFVLLTPHHFFFDLLVVSASFLSISTFPSSSTSIYYIQEDIAQSTQRQATVFMAGVRFLAAARFFPSSQP
jgi:hypothetical protein